MRFDTNRLLVGGAKRDPEQPTGRSDPYARRHLAEIIVGLLVIGVCLYIFVPAFMGTAESARRTTCLMHLRRLAQAMEMYQSDHDGQYPPSVTWVRALGPYAVRSPDEEEQGAPRRRLRTAKNREIGGGFEDFLCPSEILDPLPRPVNVPLGATASSYSYRQPSASAAGTVPFAWDLRGGSGVGAHPNGGNVAYLDGRTRWLSTNQWTGPDQP
jgi:prepilin-type processing-associated H-X9-DG protein